MARLNVATWEEFKLQLVVDQLKKQLKEAENKIEDLERENSALTEEVNELHKDLDFVTKGEDDIDKFLEALEKDLSEHPLKRDKSYTDTLYTDTDSVLIEDDGALIMVDYHAIITKINTRLKKHGKIKAQFNPYQNTVVIFDYKRNGKTIYVPFKDFVNDFKSTFDSVLDAFDINPYQE